MKIPTGPGWFVWMATNPKALLASIHDSRAAWIAVKGGDGTTLMESNVKALLGPAKAAGVAVYAWTVTYLKEPAGEAQVAAALKALGVDGVIADAETWDNGMASQATLYTRLVRSKIGDFPFGMTGMSSPANFPDFPWAEFEAHVDFQMPQWYANAFQPHASPAEEFISGLKGYRAIGNVPVVPIVATYGVAEAQDVTDTARLAASYGLTGWGCYSLNDAKTAHIAAMRVSVGNGPVPVIPAQPDTIPERVGKLEHEFATLETRVQGLEKKGA